MTEFNKNNICKKCEKKFLPLLKDLAQLDSNIELIEQMHGDSPKSPGTCIWLNAMVDDLMAGILVINKGLLDCEKCKHLSDLK
jgi:isocitrate dehydrogenase